jgi:hypothetical protein
MNTSYGGFPGGGFGYGYMMGGMFCAMQPRHMMVSDNYMMNNGYGTWGTHRGAASNGFDVIMLLIVFGFIAVMIVGGMFVARRMEK